ncbi:MAG: hypothetical protein AAF430_07840 [Myxococcota bacterium]
MKWFAVGLACFALGCAGPIVEDHVIEVAPDAFARIAVAPFLVDPELHGPLDTDLEVAAGQRKVAEEQAALMTRFVSEAFAAEGFEMVPASDLMQLLAARAEIINREDPRVFAEVAAREFGATSLLWGRLTRYRERDGGEFGAKGPASVAFALELYATPDLRKLWTARFDHTQRALSADVFTARNYPGAGSRWLSAAELAQWGARNAAQNAWEMQ